MIEEGYKDAIDTTDRYIQACKKYKSVMKEHRELESKTNALKNYQIVLKDILCRCAGKTLETKVLVRDYPIILGSCNTRMSIVNIGTLPIGESSSFHTANAIYPINYRMRRKFAAHNKYTRKFKDKVTYICSITRENIFEIECEDGFKWTGPDCWKQFSGSFDEISYTNAEEFFGFTNVSLLKLIEDLGDISSFSKYVNLTERKKQNIKLPVEA